VVTDRSRDLRSIATGGDNGVGVNNFTRTPSCPATKRFTNAFAIEPLMISESHMANWQTHWT